MAGGGPPATRQHPVNSATSRALFGRPDRNVRPVARFPLHVWQIPRSPLAPGNVTRFHPFRGGLTMGGIILLALPRMISSVFITESNKGDAAINLTGSLRLQS